MNQLIAFVRQVGLACLSGVLLAGCVTEYQPDSISLPPALIVEGQITDQPGPYTVRLSRTADYSIRSVNLLEEKATVTLADNAGNRETLIETSAGVYQTRTNGLRGVAGRQYKLTIQTRAGLQFESQPELLTAAPPILNVYTEYRNEAIPGTANRRQGWDVYIDTKDPATPGNFYRWEWTHYEPISVCQRTVRTDGSYTGLGCCSQCWDIERCYNCINTSSDANINGQAISKQLIMRAPYTSSAPYYLEVQQQAISQGAYAFWKSVRQLVGNTGGLFDPAPALVQGNIRCVSDPSILAFGYFGATGVSERGFYVDRSAGQGTPELAPPVFVPPLSPCVVCENSIYRTPNKPRWWVY
ncbi:hypothetical protein GGR92_000583 [Spirosoma lacussanchae]|uniref:DUF4249 domain-containing protein n=1 Tax=Spirosoma lacussanchae TaxID=1884249 RepID=UPI001108127F|nr:DUF4249 domain-containing protein [Spirosoma lacussanchae]